MLISFKIDFKYQTYCQKGQIFYVIFLYLFKVKKFIIFAIFLVKLNTNKNQLSFFYFLFFYFFIFLFFFFFIFLFFYFL